jgi:hypothetical protein
MRYLRLFAGALACAATLALSGGVGAGAAPASAPLAEGTTPVTIQVKVTPRNDGSVAVVATAVRPGGGPVSNLPMNLYMVADFFGKRDVLIGSDVTDTSGTAAVRYVPTWSGGHEFRAVTPGSEIYSASTGNVATQLTRTVAPYHATGGDLEGFRRAVGVIVLGATAAVWLLLLGIFLYVFRVTRLNGYGIQPVYADQHSGVLSRPQDVRS